MRAAIHNPYLDSLGGGERYTVAFAMFLISQGYEVDMEWKSTAIINQLEDRFGITLTGLNIVPDIKRGDGYDLCFWVSDGSIPSLLSRKNLLHFQVPFIGVNGRSLINKMKLFRINKVICNSMFTKRFIDREFGINSVVIYPPVDTLALKPKRKENIILSVGRFSGLLQSKHQDVLVRVFQKLFDAGARDWKLVLAGGIEVGNGDFTKQLSEMSAGYPVEILQSPDFKHIKELYGKAKIFWSASGFGEDELVAPQKVEHFGISVVEALSAQVVPVVFKAGGHSEIIQNDVNGFLWENDSELEEITRKLISDKNLLHKIAVNTVESSKKYDYQSFESSFGAIL